MHGLGMNRGKALPGLLDTTVRTVLPAIITSIVLMLTSGCGESIPDDIPPLTPVTISVTYKGSPVEGASVLLAPQSGDYSAAGLTDASGLAIMKTNGMYEGVAAGTYDASVTKREKVDLDIGPTPSDPAEYAEYSKKLKALRVPEHLVPEKYSSFAKSGLSISVTQGEPVSETFQLTD